MPDFRQMQADRCAVAAQLSDDPADAIHLVFKPSAYTDDVERAYQAVMNGGSFAGGFAALLAPLLVEWDVTDGGDPVPPTREGMRAVPIDWLRRCCEAIVGEIAKDPKQRSAPSNGGSSTPVLLPAPVPIGTPPTGPLAPPANGGPTATVSSGDAYRVPGS